MLGEWSIAKDIPAKDKLQAYLKSAFKLRRSASKIIVIEGTTPAMVMAPVINWINRRPKAIIVLSADDALYRAFVDNRRINRALARIGFRFICGAIAIGDMVATLIKKNLPGTQVVIRYPQVTEARLHSLSALEPSLGSHNMVLIGGGSAYYKGIDIATKSLGVIKKEFPDAQLTMLGRTDIQEQPDLKSPGLVKDITPFLSSSSILIHPGRGDSYPVAVIEAMLAGVVPFVSQWTGTASLVREVDPNLVIPLDAEEFAKRMAAFWNMAAEQRQALSVGCRQVALGFAQQAAEQLSVKPFLEGFSKEY